MMEVSDPVVQDIVNKLYNEVMQNQAYYAQEFIKTATFLDSKLFYQTVAEFIGVKSNEQLVIDIGCGDCRLIREIKKIKPNVTTVGVDINPLLLMFGDEALKDMGYPVNTHIGVDVAMDPSTQRLTLISDLMYGKDKSFRFKRAAINLIQEDIRYAEVTRALVRDLKAVNVIVHTLAGGFSPHIELEGEYKADNVVRAGIEMNNVVMSIGVEMLNTGGRMIWAQRVATKDVSSLSSLDFDELGIGTFKQYFSIGRIKVVNIDENKAGLGLTLPAFAPSSTNNRAIYYNNDVRKMDGYDFQGVILLIEMIRKEV